MNKRTIAITLLLVCAFGMAAHSAIPGAVNAVWE